MLGFIIGAISGAVQFWLLSKFTGAITRNKDKVKRRTILFALIQFLMPFAVLVVVAFLLPGYLMLTAIGMAAALVVSAIVRYINASKH